MISQKEIKDKAEQWKVPPDTVDKDYVLGHFLSVFMERYGTDLIFKGGTCLRKCYFEQYRFSEDLDFTARNSSFLLEIDPLQKIAERLVANTGIQIDIQEVKPLISKGVPKGFYVEIKYWGANHSKNQRPLPPHRWRTKIKIEVSTDELIVLEPEERKIIHPYSDQLTGIQKIYCYSIKEVIAEKLRALKQRSYTAPRDFYDIYFLTKDFTNKDWKAVFPVFLKKMEHKNFGYKEPGDILSEDKLIQVKRAWKSSISHQLRADRELIPEEIIDSVYKNIYENLNYGK